MLIIVIIVPFVPKWFCSSHFFLFVPTPVLVIFLPRIGALHLLMNQQNADRNQMKKDAWVAKKFCVLIKRKIQRGQQPRDPDFRELMRADQQDDDEDDAGTDENISDDDVEPNEEARDASGSDMVIDTQVVESLVEDGHVADSQVCESGGDDSHAHDPTDAPDDDDVVMEHAIQSAFPEDLENASVEDLQDSQAPEPMADEVDSPCEYDKYTVEDKRVSLEPSEPPPSLACEPNDEKALRRQQLAVKRATEAEDEEGETGKKKGKGKGKGKGRGRGKQAPKSKAAAKSKAKGGDTDETAATPSGDAKSDTVEPPAKQRPSPEIPEIPENPEIPPSQPDEPVEPAAKSKRVRSKKLKADEKVEEQVAEEVAGEEVKSFARRTRPTTSITAQQKWDAIRNAFNAVIRPHIYKSASTHEDMLEVQT
eukprot:Skav229854  [mRNA]  locus=scaffold148:43662:45672:+ [translate_table: standard]